MLRQRPEPGLDRVGHVVQIVTHGGGIHVVKNRTGRARSTVDHAGEGIVLHHSVELPVAFRYIHRDHIAFDVARQINRLTEVVDRVRSETDRHKFRSTAGVHLRHPGIYILEYVELGHLEPLAPRHLLRVGEHHGGTLLTRQGLRSERPSGSDDQVAGHSKASGLVEHDLQHVYPFVTQPFERLGVHRVSSVRERDRIDLHSTDSRILEDVQLTHKLLCLNAVAVPPPAHERTVAAVRILELFVEILGCRPGRRFGREGNQGGQSDRCRR